MMKLTCKGCGMSYKAKCEEEVPSELICTCRGMLFDSRKKPKD